MRHARIGSSFTAATALALAGLIGAVGGLTACESAPTTAAEEDALRDEVRATIARFKAEDPGMAKFFDTAYGYVVFPTVGKGGLIVGGAHGQGEVYEQGRFIGYCGLTQGTVGAQIGGQSYSEVIFFETAGPLNELRANDLEFAAQASAVAASAGASADADYDHGVLVFTMSNAGLMLEASIGGQKFDFVPRR
jgi:lipid-binding SYLF domain-containing protein